MKRFALAALMGLSALTIASAAQADDRSGRVIGGNNRGEPSLYKPAQDVGPTPLVPGNTMTSHDMVGVVAQPPRIPQNFGGADNTVSRASAIRSESSYWSSGYNAGRATGQTEGVNGAAYMNQPTNDALATDNPLGTTPESNVY